MRGPHRLRAFTGSYQYSPNCSLVAACFACSHHSFRTLSNVIVSKIGHLYSRSSKANSDPPSYSAYGCIGAGCRNGISGTDRWRVPIVHGTDVRRLDRPGRHIVAGWRALPAGTSTFRVQKLWTQVEEHVKACCEPGVVVSVLSSCNYESSISHSCIGEMGGEGSGTSKRSSTKPDRW